MHNEGDRVATPPAREVARNIMPEGVIRDPPNLSVPDRLLDLMAAEDEGRHLAAVKALEIKRKVTRAENYLRRKFR